MRSLTPNPVPPFGRYSMGSRNIAVPAISRCIHGVWGLTKCSRNFAAVMVPAGIPPIFLMDAEEDLSWSA